MKTWKIFWGLGFILAAVLIILDAIDVQIPFTQIFGDVSLIAAILGLFLLIYTLARLISMPNVIVTSHQAFLTEDALANIAMTTVNNIIDISKHGRCPNELCYRGGTAEDCKTGKCF